MRPIIAYDFIIFFALLIANSHELWNKRNDDRVKRMRELEKTLKAAANRRRLAILKYLKEKREAPVGEIAAEISLSFKSTSRHLAILAAIDILEKDQRSLQVFYRISSIQRPVVKHILSIL